MRLYIAHINDYSWSLTAYKVNLKFLYIFWSHIKGNVGGPASPIIPVRTSEIDFSCKFEKNYELTVDFHSFIGDNNLKIPTIDKEFDVQMGIYTDSSFLYPQQSNAVIEVPDLLYSQINLTNGPNYFNIQLRQCWATPTWVHLFQYF